MCLVSFAINVWSANRIKLVSDTVTSPSFQELFFTFKGFSSAGPNTTLNFEIRAANIPFAITGVKFISGDSVYRPITNFSMTVPKDSVYKKLLTWDATVEIRHLDNYSVYDRLVVETDIGEFEMFSAREAILLEKSAEENSRTKLFASITVAIGLLTVILLTVNYRRRLNKRNNEMLHMADVVEEMRRNTDLLRDNVSELYSRQMETLNMLCNGYFERSGSDKTRLTLYNEVEKQILAMRSPENVERLGALVNKYMDNILVRLRTQVPGLTANDITFVTYLYAGFSPKAICIFCDIKIKNFYNRRSRLKEKILTSGASDSELFISKI